MADAPKSAVYSVKASFSVGDSVVEDGAAGSCPVSSFTVEWGINDIPRARVVLPLSYGWPAGHSYVYSGSDASVGHGTSTFDTVQALADHRGTCSFRFSVYPVSGVSSGSNAGLEMALKGWNVSQVFLDPQTRVSPGGVVVCMEHPISRLADAPGFLSISDSSFVDRMLSSVESASSVIDVADSVLDTIYANMNRKALSLDGTSKEGLQEKLKNSKIGSYVDPGDVGGIWPYTHLIEDGGDDSAFYDLVQRACKRTLARQFLHSVSVENGSSPWGAFTGIMADLGVYVSILPEQERGKLRVLQPWESWSRDYPNRVQDNVVYSTRVSPDSYPICGIRVQGVADNQASVESTNTGPTAVDDRGVEESSDTAAATPAVGDTVYYHSSYGKVLTVFVPQFARAMIGEAAMMQASGKGGHSTIDERRRVSYDQLDSELYDGMQVIAGSTVKADELEAGILKATAESTFAILFRARATAEVTMPAVVEYGQLAAPGSMMEVSVGTGGKGLEGVLQTVTVHGSCSDGVCSCVYGISHVGGSGYKPASDLRNCIWT